MRLLVTGGGGFIGSNLVRTALRHPGLTQVRVLDDFSTGYEENLHGVPVELHRGSVCDPDALARSLKGIDGVVHLAAIPSVPRSLVDPRRSYEVNVSGTVEVLEACRTADVGHVVVASSSSVYGANPAEYKNERGWVRPLSPYAAGKLAAEQMALAYQESFGLGVSAFRFFNVYGPRQPAGHTYSAVVPVFVDALLRGTPVPVHGDGAQTRDFTFVDSVCRVLVESAVTAKACAEPVNLAFGTRTSIAELVSLLEEVTGRSARIDWQPPRSADVRASRADSGLLHELYPAAEPVALRDGLRSTAEWFATRPSTSHSLDSWSGVSGP
ncbi:MULTISPECIES: NAD-dependent epimerase/dehydratase family protein [Mumia]|uniref:NAD-dependent epimerase/dehydratase family protein n=1 Tax=Mumia TaxID=1546255 RepID=UPI0014205E2D|nr:NAD-dependent epimerase/dehydratase family protein [Mumia sp. ZJ430]